MDWKIARPPPGGGKPGRPPGANARHCPPFQVIDRAPCPSPTSSPSAAPRSTTSRTSPWTSRRRSWWCSPASPARARARSPSTPSTPRASAATWRASRPMRGSSSGRWRSRKYDTIRGLSPTISIEQKAASNNPRSTVGTVTEVHDYLRVLYASIGVQHCPNCGKQAWASRAPSRSSTRSSWSRPRAPRCMVLAPVVSNRKGEHKDMLAEAQKRGFSRARIDGKVKEPRGADRAGQEVQARHRARHRPRGAQARGHQQPAHRLGGDGAARGQGHAHRHRRQGGPGERPRHERAQRLPRLRPVLRRAHPRGRSPSTTRWACARTATAWAPGRRWTRSSSSRMPRAPSATARWSRGPAA